MNFIYIDFLFPLFFLCSTSERKLRGVQIIIFMLLDAWCCLLEKSVHTTYIATTFYSFNDKSQIIVVNE